MRTNQTYKVFLNKETINNNNNKIIGLIITYIHPKHTNYIHTSKTYKQLIQLSSNYKTKQSNQKIGRTPK